VCVLEKCAPPALLRGLQRKMETLKFDLQEEGWLGEAAGEPGHQLKMAITSQEFIAWMRYHTHTSRLAHRYGGKKRLILFFLLGPKKLMKSMFSQKKKNLFSRLLLGLKRTKVSEDGYKLCNQKDA
jgi:hypothetical protein